ncbi:hypothetical protein CWN88_09915 [Vibrio splendidus]|uniref:hypothetical protein n=1 Tax=Vibrio splendidus TaxID=29497 RepID=UPI000D340000|nr:hypothetical protein [Vibrio splendidus]PTP02768.1 hypothetical protein CWN88_09915 [Vibrio splendidus]
MSGIFINELRLKGSGQADASVTFKEGANIITGPSNTGKTFVFECLEYMFGKSKLERRVTQSNTYQNIYLEIKDHVGDVFTLKSDFDGGDFYLYECPINDIDNNSRFSILKRKHTPKKTNTLSYFILSKCDLDNRWVRTNQKGKKSELSLRSLRLLYLVNELRIPTITSPFLSGQHTDKTKETCVLKLLITGEDDQNIIETPSDKVINNKSGRLELLAELIEREKKKSDSKESIDNLEEQENKLENSLSAEKEKSNNLFEESKELESQRLLLQNRLHALSSEKKELESLRKNSSVIEQQYYSDINRLSSTLEMGIALKSLEVKSCPVCYNDFKRNDNHTKRVHHSAQAELKKIDGMLYELTQVKKQFDKEIEDLTLQLSDSQVLFDDNSIQLERLLSSSLKYHMSNVDNLQIKLRAVKMELSSRYYLDELIQQKEEMEELIQSSKGTRDFPSINTSMMEKLSLSIEEYLIDWGYMKVGSGRVIYSETDDDFVIAGESRKLAGKGYRSITHAAFTLSLIKNNTGLGLCVMDSPLVTYKKPEVPKGEEITQDMATKFYTSLTNIDKSQQVIVIENEDVPKHVSSKVHHIHFTKNSEHGRYGFIPVN